MNGEGVDGEVCFDAVLIDAPFVQHTAGVVDEHVQPFLRGRERVRPLRHGTRLREVHGVHVDALSEEEDVSVKQVLGSARLKQIFSSIRSHIHVAQHHPGYSRRSPWT